MIQQKRLEAWTVSRLVLGASLFWWVGISGTAFAGAVENGNAAYLMKDYPTAVKWYRKAADAGDADGQTSLGLLYEHGWGVTLDYAAAVKWYRKAADQGNVLGQANLGAMYEYGKGVTQDSAAAASWYRKAADQGDADEQAYLGLMYEHGWGVTQDYAAAVKWYRKAADQGNVLGQANLGAIDLAPNFYPVLSSLRRLIELLPILRPRGSRIFRGLGSFGS